MQWDSIPDTYVYRRCTSAKSYPQIRANPLGCAENFVVIAQHDEKDQLTTACIQPVGMIIVLPA